MSKSFYTIQTATTTELVIERSRFIGHCQEVSTETDAKAFVAKIREEHAQATHNCYAYRIGTEGHPLEYFNDHGEPSGTAGKPILGAIQRLNLTNVVIVVTRYFGGKKLGVRGLIEAYGQAASLVLERAGVIQRIPKFSAVLIYQYAQHSNVLYRMQKIDAEVTSTEYAEVIRAQFLIPKANETDFRKLINELSIINVEVID